MNIDPYMIQNIDQTQDDLVIKARKVKSTITGCSHVTIAEIWQSSCEWNMETQMMEGCWREIRTNKYITLDLDPYQPQITWTADQRWYLDEGQWLNYVETSAATHDTPLSIWVTIRFRTTDPRNGVEVFDYIEFKVESSMEDYSDFCVQNWASLDIDEPMSGSRTYKIADKKMKEIQVWSKITGKELLAGTGCEQ
jgi:hypothetical protein